MKCVFSRKGKKGFTLIELLIVVAIVGLLASIVLISLGPARARARDTKRIADVRQMSTAIEVEGSDGFEPIETCTGADANVTTCTGPGAIAGFSSFQDPRGTAVCDSTSADVCQYSISRADGTAGATTGNYQICFWLEVGTATLGADLHSIENNGVFGTCN